MKKSALIVLSISLIVVLIFFLSACFKENSLGKERDRRDIPARTDQTSQQLAQGDNKDKPDNNASTGNSSSIPQTDNNSAKDNDVSKESGSDEPQSNSSDSGDDSSQDNNVDNGNSQGNPPPSQDNPPQDEPPQDNPTQDNKVNGKWVLVHTDYSYQQSQVIDNHKYVFTYNNLQPILTDSIDDPTTKVVDWVYDFTTEFQFAYIPDQIIPNKDVVISLGMTFPVNEFASMEPDVYAYIGASYGTWKAQKLPSSYVLTGRFFDSDNNSTIKAYTHSIKAGDSINKHFSAKLNPELGERVCIQLIMKQKLPTTYTYFYEWKEN